MLPLFSYYGRVARVICQGLKERKASLAKDSGALHSVFGPIRFKTKVRLFDIDMNRHMNNARYLEAAEMGRFDMMTKSGLLQSAVQALRDKCSANPFMPDLASCTVKYIRQLKFQEKYYVESSICAADEKYVYFNQSLYKEKNGTLASKIFCKAALLGRDFSSGTEKKFPMRVVPPQEFMENLILEGYMPGHIKSYEDVVSELPPITEDMYIWIKGERPNSDLKTRPGKRERQ